MAEPTVDVASKRCTKCKEVKPLAEFHRGGTTGRRADCKVCVNASQRAFQRAHKEATGQWRTHAYTYERICEGCGKVWTSRESKGRFCSTSCHNLRRRWYLVCRGCGDLWAAPAPTSYYCSDACRLFRRCDYEAARASHAQVAVWERPPGWVHPRLAERASAAQKPVRPLRKRWYAGQCSACGEWFISGSHAAVTCSLLCYGRIAAHERRALVAEAFVAPVRPFKIFERDKWICQLCRKPVRRNAVAPHPLAPTIDHIVPLTPKRGAPKGTHEPANVHCAHFSCNARKRNGGGGEQMLLIG